MHIRLFLVGFLALAAARAEIFQSSRWAAVGLAEASAGYDSNLELAAGGAGSAFVSADPSVIFRRHGSATKLDLRLAADLTWFERHADTQVDGSAAVDYAYPQVEGQLPRFTGRARWARLTAGNTQVGRRLTLNDLEANFGGRLYSTGKFGLEARLAADRQDYSEDDFSTNERARLTVGALYAPDPKKEIALNVTGSTSSSEPHAASAARVRGRELDLTLQGRGQLGPKIEGMLYAGVGAVRYRGAFARSDVLPLAGGEVTWRAAERARVAVGIDVGANFSPAGESLRVHRLNLEYRQVIRGPWSGRLRLSPALTNFYQETHYRRDRSLGGGASLNYDPSERFGAGLSFDFITQRSDLPFARFERTLTSANLSYRF